MREMSDSDLDALAGELGVGEEVGKVGLIVPQSESVEDDTPSGSTPAVEKNGGGDIIIGETGVEEAQPIIGASEKVMNPDLELEKKFAEIEVGGKLPKDEVPKDGQGGEVGLKEVASAGLSKLENAVVGGRKNEDKATEVIGKEKLD